MKIIDTHIHFWDLSNKINNWVSRETNEPFLNKNYMPDMLTGICTADLCGVLHVEAHDSEIPTTIEIEWLESVMQANTGLKYWHIAFADITAPVADFQNMITQIKTYKNVVGIRHIMSHRPGFKYSPCKEDLSKNSNILQNLTYLAQNNLIFDCQMYPNQIENILPAISSSNVTTLIDHLVLPQWEINGDDDHKMWMETIAKLALLDNVYIKVSGLDMFKQEAEFNSVIKHFFETFPIKRSMYGSNYPVSFNHDYNFWHNYLNKLKLTHDEKDGLFFRNAHDLFLRHVSK